jgi:cytochrome d ubiquinol oxidase subunit I
MTTDPAFWHRLQFAFTITYHYLFPQLTMGVAWFLVYWTWRGQRPGGESPAAASRFWTRIFGLTFALGVVTGIPMEFQFGTNWAAFSDYAGGIIGQTLAMEGMFAFLLESAFIGALLWGAERLGPRLHLAAAVGVAAGSWLSGYFIIVTNAFMQRPGRSRRHGGRPARARRSRRVSPQRVGVDRVRAQPGGGARHR